MPGIRGICAWLVAMVLLPGAAAAQKSAYVAGFRELERAMLAADAVGANAAIDRMAAALSGWEAVRAAPSPEPLLDDEAAKAPSLPLAAYADGFARIGRGEYREALPRCEPRRPLPPASGRSWLPPAGSPSRKGTTRRNARCARSFGRSPRLVSRTGGSVGSMSG